MAYTKNNEIISRIVHKHDTETNWNKAINFIPLMGEIIVYDTDENYNYERFKIGDGKTTVINLPFQKTNINDLKAVSYDIAQELTDEQKIQARANIGAGTPDSIKIIEATYYANGESTISSTEEEINALIAEGKNVCIDCFIEPEDRTFRFYFSTKTSSGTTLFVNTEVSDGAPELKLLTLIGSTFMIITMPIPLRSLATESKDGLMSTEDKVKLDSIEEGAQVNVQSDLSQTDEAAADYVKGVIRQESLPEGYPYTKVTATDISGQEYEITGFTVTSLSVTHNLNIPFELGQVWSAGLGRLDYECEVQVADDGTLYIGSIGVSDLPFYITANEGEVLQAYMNNHRDESAFYLQCVSGTVTETTIHPMDEKFLPSSATAQSDWSISDENDPAYVKNRTHYDSREIVSTILEGTRANLPEASYELNKEYRIQFGDTEYACTIQGVYLSPAGCDVYCLGGNPWYVDGYSEYPFSIVIGESTKSIENIAATINVPEAPASPITVSILLGGELKQLDPKYIKDMYHEESSEVFSIENAEFDDGRYINETPFIITDGNTYVVNWDGAEYACAAYTFSGLPVIGNTSEFGGKGNNEPFYIIYVSAENINPIIALDGSTPTHTVSVIENAVHTIDHKYIKDMYYDNGSTTTLLVDNQTVTGFEVMKDPIYAVMNPFSFSPVVGATYTVTWDGTDYECTASVVDVFTYIGNVNYLSMQSGGDIPFAIVFDADIFLVTESTEESHIISITKVVHDMQQIDEKFLPDSVNNVVDNLTMVLAPTEYTLSYAGYWQGTDNIDKESLLVEGCYYKVIFNEAEFISQCKSIGTTLYIGNTKYGYNIFESSDCVDTGEPCLIAEIEYEHGYRVRTNISGTCTISIQQLDAESLEPSVNYISSDLLVDIPIEKLPTMTVPYGGTGRTSITSGSYLVGNGESYLKEKTPLEVLEDIENAGFSLSLVSPDGSEWALDVSDNGELKTVRDTSFKEIVERTVTIIDSNATGIDDYVFYNCTSLTTANFPVAAYIRAYAFYNCTALTTADFHVATKISVSAFNNCSALTALILRSETMCTLSSTSAFTSSAIASGTGYIYVPSALVDTYKANSAWSTYAAQFRAIEDYPDICGGED